MSPGTMRARPATLGIVGLGRIGKRMAHISRNVFKRVVAYDPHIIDSDFPPSSAHRRPRSPGGPTWYRCTRHSMPRRAAWSTRSSSPQSGRRFFVNTSRGAVVNLPDLVEALEARALPARRSTSCPRAGAARSPLLKHPRNSHAARRVLLARGGKGVAAQGANIISWLATGKPEYVVTPGTRSPQLRVDSRPSRAD